MAYFYNATTKVYIVAFSKLFSDIHVHRVDPADQVVKDIKVPLVYASKNKISYELQKNPDASAASVVLPVIGFNIEGLTYSPQRKLNSLNQLNVDDGKSMYEGVPFDYQFAVNIRTKYQDDLWQILEQVLYYFKPDVSLDVKELAHPDFARDVQVTLNAVSFENELELSQAEESQRNFIANLDCTLKGYVYPSASDDVIIEHVTVNLFDNLNAEIARISHDFIDPDIITTIEENYGDGLE
jgi:hypothetical protein